MSAYPAWDNADKKGSFMKINDMLIAEVGLAREEAVEREHSSKGDRA